MANKNVRLPRIHGIHPKVDFESSRSRAKSDSLNRPNLQCFCCITHMTISVDEHSCDEYRISNDLNVCHKLVSIK